MNIIVELKLRASIQTVTAVQWVSQTATESRILYYKSQNNIHQRSCDTFFFPISVLHFLVRLYKKAGKQNLSWYLPDNTMYLYIVGTVTLLLDCGVHMHILDLHIIFSLKVDDLFFGRLDVYKEIL